MSSDVHRASKKIGGANDFSLATPGGHANLYQIVGNANDLTGMYCSSERFVDCAPRKVQPRQHLVSQLISEKAK
jgi:hypothetical protein